MLAVLSSAVKQLRWRLPDPSTVFFPAGSSHDAYVEIRKIVESVTTEVLIVDPYVNHTLWGLLTNVPNGAKIGILTERPKPNFALEGRTFAKQHRNSIEARRTASYHDRFIFTDDKRCWHLGASIKDAGTKAFALSEFLEPNIVLIVKRAVESTWATATPLPM
jgi:hypothetical protein